MFRKTDTRTASGRRTSSRRRGSGFKVSWTEITAMVIVIFCLGFILGRLSANETSYKGLGEAHEIPLNEYDQTAYYYTDDGRLHYEDDDYTSIQVMDVSYAQKNIDWQKVKEDGIDMAMIRLGYRGYETGQLNLDEYYDANCKGAKEAGIEAGVYFFSQAITVEEAEEEAKYAIKYYKKKKLKGPIAFDMEPINGANRITHLTTEERTAIADAFMSYVKKKGYEPLLYGNPTWLRGSLDLSLLTDYDVWLAHYIDVTAYPYDYVMWQYTSKGKVAGITGNVDLNVMLVKK